MPSVSFTSSLNRHLDCPDVSVEAATVSDALSAVFRENPRLRGYILDEQGRLRQHVAVFVDGEAIRDREHLSDGVGQEQEIFVMQALSGG